MTYQEAFNKIKELFNDADTSAFKSDFAAQVTMTDSDCGGTFYIQFKDSKLAVEPYDYKDNSVFVNISYDNFVKVLSGDADIIKLLNCGDAVSEGNTAVLEDMCGCVKAKKAEPVKAAKKAAPAKAAAETKAEPVKAAEKKSEPAKAAETKAAATKAAKTTAAKTTASKTTASKTTTAKKTATRKTKKTADAE